MTPFKERQDPSAPNRIVVAMFCSFGDSSSRAFTQVNVGVVLARRGYRVACASLARQSYPMDQLLAGGDDSKVRAFRRKAGLYVGSAW
jgi:hypothetical protein